MTTRKKLVEEISAALPMTNLRFGSAILQDELYTVMETEDSKLKRKVLGILLSGRIRGIVLTASSSHPPRIAINSEIWIEPSGRQPFYVPIKAQKNEVIYE